MESQSKQEALTGIIALFMRCQSDASSGAKHRGGARRRGFGKGKKAATDLCLPAFADITAHSRACPLAVLLRLLLGAVGHDREREWTSRDVEAARAQEGYKRAMVFDERWARRRGVCGLKRRCSQEILRLKCGEGSQA